MSSFSLLTAQTLVIKSIARPYPAPPQARKLRPVSFRILRLLVNGSLALACALGRTEQVKKLKPEVGRSSFIILAMPSCPTPWQADLSFFVSHMKQDFGLIAKLANISPEQARILWCLTIFDHV